MKPKLWWKSKTIWLNAAAGGVAFAAGAWDAYSGTLALPKGLVLLLGSLVAAANVGLRFVTTDPVVLKELGDDPNGANGQ